MGQHILQVLRELLAAHGYWAVAVMLLLENAGLPVPGETTLLLASFLAFSEHRLQLPYIILVATCAAAVGDNLGYWIGHRGGRSLFRQYEHIGPLRHAIKRSEALFQRYGSVAIFFARFIAGMRIVAGPLAGFLRMPWGAFFLWNFLGAIVWATVISLVGYFLGRNWDTLIRFVGRLDIAVVLLALAVVLVAWWTRRRVRQ